MTNYLPYPCSLHYVMNGVYDSSYLDENPIKIVFGMGSKSISPVIITFILLFISIFAIYCYINESILITRTSFVLGTYGKPRPTDFQINSRQEGLFLWNAFPNINFG